MKCTKIPAKTITKIETLEPEKIVLELSVKEAALLKMLIGQCPDATNERLAYHMYNHLVMVTPFYVTNPFNTNLIDGECSYERILNEACK